MLLRQIARRSCLASIARRVDVVPRYRHVPWNSKTPIAFFLRQYSNDVQSSDFQKFWSTLTAKETLALRREPSMRPVFIQLFAACLTNAETDEEVGQLMQQVDQYFHDDVYGALEAIEELYQVPPKDNFQSLLEAGTDLVKLKQSADPKASLQTEIRRIWSSLSPTSSETLHSRPPHWRLSEFHQYFRLLAHPYFIGSRESAQLEEIFLQAIAAAIAHAPGAVEKAEISEFLSTFYGIDADAAISKALEKYSDSPDAYRRLLGFANNGLYLDGVAPDSELPPADTELSPTTALEEQVPRLTEPVFTAFVDALSSRAANDALRFLSDEESHELAMLLSRLIDDSGNSNLVVAWQLSVFLADKGIQTIEFDKIPTEPQVWLYGYWEFDPKSVQLAQLELAGSTSDVAVEPEEPTPAPSTTPNTVGQSAENALQDNRWPDLMAPDPLLDEREVLDIPPTPENPYHNRVIVRNHKSIFHSQQEWEGMDWEETDAEPTTSDLIEEDLSPHEVAGVPKEATENLFRFPIVLRRTVQQTAKGRIQRAQCFMVVGDGNGMLGYGMGKSSEEEGADAVKKAYLEALKNMDYVERFENRTIWTEVETKFGATKLILRPRPVGFGLRCGPVLHKVLRAAGIKDISAKVWGSRNPIMVMQAAVRLLQGGHAPLGMGDGVGGKGKRMYKGSGIKGQFDMERARGRKLIPLRK